MQPALDVGAVRAISFHPDDRQRGRLCRRARFIYTQGDVVAYPTTCTDGCQSLATLVLGGANETPIAVAGGRIYATTVNGSIDSLGLPPP